MKEWRGMVLGIILAIVAIIGIIYGIMNESIILSKVETLIIRGHSIR